jgi:hypothetical protein
VFWVTHELICRWVLMQGFLTLELIRGVRERASAPRYLWLFSSWPLVGDARERSVAEV